MTSSISLSTGRGSVYMYKCSNPFIIKEKLIRKELLSELSKYNVKVKVTITVVEINGFCDYCVFTEIHAFL